MHRTVTSSICLFTNAGAARVAFLVAAARADGLVVDDSLTCTIDGDEVVLAEHATQHRGRMHVLELPDGAASGRQVRLDYRATVGGEGETRIEPDPVELFSYLRPSRYAESDRLFAMARSEFGSLPAGEVAPAIARWVHSQLFYVVGSSRVTDGAVETLLARRGVCRDFAHLVVALLRALDIPARLASVYAPGLSPMDFHAVAEAWVDGRWEIIDATHLAPRESMLRIATGRDAADTAFMSAYGAGMRLESLTVTATVDGDLPVEQWDEVVVLS